MLSKRFALNIGHRIEINLVLSQNCVQPLCSFLAYLLKAKIWLMVWSGLIESDIFLENMDNIDPGRIVFTGMALTCRAPAAIIDLLESKFADKLFSRNEFRVCQSTFKDDYFLGGLLRASGLC